MDFRSNEKIKSSFYDVRLTTLQLTYGTCTMYRTTGRIGKICNMVWRVSYVVQLRASYLSISRSGKTGDERKAISVRGRACWVFSNTVIRGLAAYGRSCASQRN